MKIREIIREYEETDFRVRRRKQNFDYDTLKDKEEREYDRSQAKGVQPGWYSSGQTNPRDPHEFVKKPHLTTLMDKDAYFKYTKEINELRRQGYHNPFFPQVYNVDITQDQKGNQRPRYRIEKLQAGDQFPPETLVGMYERLFYDEFDMQRIDSYSNKSWAVWSEIADQCNRAVERSNYTNIKDDQLKEALMLIDKILQENPDWNVDLHTNNIRVRGSGVGPQLVLMDPISDGGKSIPDYDDIRYGPNRRSPKPEYPAGMNPQFLDPDINKPEPPPKTKPPHRPDWSTFKNMAMGHKSKPKELPDTKRLKDSEPVEKKRPGLGTLLKNKLNQAK